MYNKITHADITALRAIAGAANILTGENISEDYGHDELGDVEHMPDVLVRIHSTEEIAAVMKLAYDRRLPVVIRGSGTGLVGAAVAIEGGVMLETTGMNKILELDEDNLTVTVQPGVLLMDLADFAAQRGFLYPPDPGEKTATIGGNISTNAGGMRAVKYGVTRDYVRALTVVLANGQILTLGGKVVKNSSGYSLKDLIVGAEGTLAVIAEATLKLIPLPAVSISLLAPFPAMETALEAVPEIIRSKTAPTAVEYMSREIILYSEEYLGKRFPDTHFSAYLLLTFDGSAREQVERDFACAADLLLKMGAEDVYIVDTEERKKSVWDARGAFLEAIKASTTAMDECDVVVPRGSIAEYIKYSHLVAKELDMRIPSFGHAGDGNLHIYLCRDGLDEKTWRACMNNGFNKLYAKAAELGGFPSGEHGVGFAKKAYLREMVGEEQIALMIGIKRVFDPRGILNPGKIFDLPQEESVL